MQSSSLLTPPIFHTKALLPCCPSSILSVNDDAQGSQIDIDHECVAGHAPHSRHIH